MLERALARQELAVGSCSRGAPMSAGIGSTTHGP